MQDVRKMSKDGDGPSSEIIDLRTLTFLSRRTEDAFRGAETAMDPISGRTVLKLPGDPLHYSFSSLQGLLLVERAGQVLEVPLASEIRFGDGSRADARFLADG